MAERTWRQAVAVTAVFLVAGLAGCESPTEPQFSSGSMSFDWAPEAGGEAATWSVSGSCGTRGFLLGSSTCAVGSDETQYIAALGVRTLEDGEYDTATLVHPTGEGSCEVSSEANSTCTLGFFPGRRSETEPFPRYLLSTGTIEVEVVVVEGQERLMATFEGTAIDASVLEAAPIVITGGVLDVELVR